MNDSERTQIFDQWMRDHQGLLFKVVGAFASLSQDREDLFQQITIQLWKSIASYDRSVAATTWIYRVAFYTANGWYRKERRRQDQSSLLGDADAVLIESQEPVDPRLEALFDQISAMDEVDRSVTLMLLDGFSYREISEVLGISSNNVGVRIHRIKKKLTRNLNSSSED